MQLSPESQVMLHPPQWFTLVLMSTQDVPQHVWIALQLLPVPPHLQEPFTHDSPGSH
jgi:hypothetical protein